MKRIISVLMLVCLMASFCTLSAFAADHSVSTQPEFEGAMSIASNGDTIILGAGNFEMVEPNATITIKYSAGTNLTFPGGEKYEGRVTYDTGSTGGSGGGAGGGIMLLSSPGSTVSVANETQLRDALADPDVSVINIANSFEYYVTPGENYGLLINRSVTINGKGNTLTFKDASNAYYLRSINIDTTGTVNINDLSLVSTAERGLNFVQGATANLTNVKVDVANYAVNVPTAGAGATINIKGGSYSGRNVMNIWGKVALSIEGASESEKVVLTTKGSDAEGYGTITLSAGSNGTTISLKNTKLEYTTGSGGSNLIISNGDDVEQILIDRGGNEFTKSPFSQKQVAIISYPNDTFYSCATLAEAIEQAEKDGSTKISILCDFDMGGEVAPVSKDMTIDFDGKHVSNGALKVADGATVTITGWAGTEEQLKDFLGGKPVTTLPQAPAAKPAVSNPYSVPATGDMSNMPLWAVLFVGFAAVAVLTRKKKA